MAYGKGWIERMTCVIGMAAEGTKNDAPLFILNLIQDKVVPPINHSKIGE